MLHFHPPYLLYPHRDPHSAKERAQDQKANIVNVPLSEDHSGTISLNYIVYISLHGN